MPLFQKNVFRTYWEATRALPACQDAYKRLVAHFGNPKIQKNILASKEEQYQEGFLRDLFVDILGYTLAPQPDYNLTTELKNPNSSQKVDGAIVNGEQVKAVIELKSAKTIDLYGVMAQAFLYKNSHKGCKYVLTSNFTKLRFYIEDNNEFLEFDLFKMTEEAFAQLYTVLHKDSILKDLPTQIKKESTAREDEITNAFYEVYQLSKDELFGSMLQENPAVDRLVLFEKTQKFLDRLVFILFAQHKRLLPANLVGKIIENWKVLVEMEGSIPLYDRFKKYFNYLDTGNVGKPHDIFGYNGGLFSSDSILDNLQMKDVILENVCKTLNNYDFDSDIDVNILGHIFERGLANADEQRKLLKDNKTNISDITKANLRKKAGIYYTPRHITQYMVQNTLGELCHSKKEELELLSIDFENTLNEVILAKILAYETWLHTLKVLDPACGSGAFLNQVLDFLLKEYTWVGVLKKNCEKPKDDFFAHLPIPEEEPNYAHPILENNIFGVDLNPDSIQITKLSLWLRTAKNRKKLSDLRSNIKQGNSLISDKNITNDAFDWETEFPNVFANGGKFTVIVGNPPYVSANNMDFAERQYFNESKQYKMLSGKWDLYVPFVERSLQLLENDGLFSFIIPFGLLNQAFATNLRKWILEEFSLKSIVDLHDTKVFESATVPTCIPLIKKAPKQFLYVSIVHYLKEKEDFITSHTISIDKYHKTEMNMFRTEKLDDSFDTLEKIKAIGSTVGDLFYVSTGAEIHGKESRDAEGTFTSGYERSEILETTKQIGLKPFIEGSVIPKSRLLGRYCYPEIPYYIDYDNKAGNMRSPKFKELFENSKIIIRKVSGLLGLLATFDERHLYTSEGVIIVADISNVQQHKKIQNQSNSYSLKALLGILNSQAIHFYYKSVFGGFVNVFPNYVKSLPIPTTILPTIEAEIVGKVDTLLAWHKDFASRNQEFQKVLETNFGLEKVSEKLENWYELDWKTFIREMEKAKSPISTKKQFDWATIFEEKKDEVVSLLQLIQKTEQEIDLIVYNLYGLTPQETSLIENI